MLKEPEPAPEPTPAPTAPDVSIDTASEPQNAGLGAQDNPVEEGVDQSYVFIANQARELSQRVDYLENAVAEKDEYIEKLIEVLQGLYALQNWIQFLKYLSSIIMLTSCDTNTGLFHGDPSPSSLKM